MNNYLINVLRFVLLLFLQVLILNNIRVGFFINPFIYILFVLLLPFSTPKWLLLISAFAMGLSIDWFMATPGLHTSATVFMAFLRPTVIRIVSGPKMMVEDENNSILQKDKNWFFIYSTLLVLVHHISLFFLEAFSFNQLGHTFLRILLSVIFSEIIILLLVYFFAVGKKR